MISEEEIKKLAKSIWEVEKRPEGRDKDHYFRAKQMLEEKEKVILNMDKTARLMAIPEDKVAN